MPDKNAWDDFRYGNDYTNFKNGCLNNTQDYGVIQFTDGDINNKLRQGDSEFIEIYRNDANRTPCVVIEYASKPVDQGDNMTYTSKTRYLYRDSDFFEQFGSLKVLTHFDITASDLRSDILNGSQNLNKMYDFSEDFDIRNEQYRELKKLLLSDPFCIDLVNMNHDNPRHLYEDGDNMYYDIYYDTMVNKYYTPKFRIIERDTMHSKNKNQYLKILSPDSIFLKTPDIIHPRNNVDFMPLLVCQSVLINRLVNWLKNIQCAWTDKDKRRLWALRGIEKGSK